MATLPPTDTERIAQLEQQLAAILTRLRALEDLEARRLLHEAGLSPAAGAYLQTEIFGAVAGSQDADALSHFQ